MGGVVTAPETQQQATDNGTVEGTAEEVEPRALAVQPHPPTLAVTPQVQAKELVERLAVIREAMEKAMVKDVDYGVIPGTDKPALYKPGAEKLAVLFQLDVQPVQEKLWGPDDHLTVSSVATVFHSPTGSRLGRGEGMCSTREKKYAYRQQERTCPHCKRASVIKGKAEYGGGWLCWKKRDGCGAKFPDGDASIEGQEVGQVDNPDLPDIWNTIVKMAEKRARVDAVLAVTGASALFTQDVEDTAPSEPQEPAPAPEVPGPDRISDQDADALMKAVKAAGVKADQVKLKLTNLGVEEEMTSVRQALGLLTNAQADEFFVWLEEMKG